MKAKNRVVLPKVTVGYLTTCTVLEKGMTIRDVLQRALMICMLWSQRS